MLFKNKNKIYISSGLSACLLLATALIFFVLIEVENPVFLSLKFHQEDKEIAPDEPLVIVFNQPMRKKSVESSFSIIPEIKGSLKWSYLNQILTFSPVVLLEPDTKYKVEINNAQSVLGVSHFVDVNFSTIKMPKVISVNPPNNSQGADPNADIIITFDKSAEGFDYKFSLLPTAIKFETVGNKEKTSFALKLKEPLSKDTLYTLIIHFTYKSDKKTLPFKKVYEGSFTTANKVEIVKITPENDSTVSEFQNISVVFNKDIEREEAEKRFLILPETKGDFKWEGTKISFYPYKFDYNTEYQVVLKKGISSFDGSYTVQDTSFKFKVGPKPSGNPKANPILPQEAIINTGKYIDINTTTQTLAIFQDGKMLGAYSISTGKASMPTPTGQFKVRSKSLRAYSKKYGLYMPFWMAFTSAGHGIHELPEWPGGYKEGANHLGIPVSHGCVRLGVGPAEIVYNFADIGTPVVAHR